MADKWAVATGNWSSTATWNDGTLPTAADDVYADGFTVTIDQNVTVLSIRTTQRSGGTAGGNFVLNGGITLTADVRAGSSSCLTYASVASSFIVGNVYGSNTTGSCRGVVISGGAGTLTITGNIFGGSQSSTDGVLFFTSSPLNVIGNITGGSGSSSHGVTIGTSYNSTVTVTGNVTGGTVSNGGGLFLNSGSPTVLVTGNVTAGFNQAGVFLSAGTVTVTGNVTSTTNAVAVSSPTFRFNGLGFSGPTGAAPFYSSNVLINATNTQQLEFRVNNAGVAGVARSLYTGGVNLNQPAVNNVRSGTVYGASNEFTGTCAVPPPSSVAFGVAVDNTTGLAAITPSSIRAALGLASANLDTQLSQIAPSSIRGALGLASGNLDAQFTSLQSNSPSEFF